MIIKIKVFIEAYSLKCINETKIKKSFLKELKILKNYLLAIFTSKSKGQIKLLVNIKYLMTV